jgi:hypothetical protein
MAGKQLCWILQSGTLYSVLTMGRHCYFVSSINDGCKVFCHGFHIRRTSLLTELLREMTLTKQEEPTLTDMLFLIFNFAACGPVWLCVGMFSVYHLYLASGNSTTIEGWEKDKVATLVRRGKIHDVKYPYVSLVFFTHDERELMIECRLHQESQIGPWPQPTLVALASEDAR